MKENGRTFDPADQRASVRHRPGKAVPDDRYRIAFSLDEILDVPVGGRDEALLGWHSSSHARSHERSWACPLIATSLRARQSGGRQTAVLPAGGLEQVSGTGHGCESAGR